VEAIEYWRMFEHAVSAAILRTEIHATKQNVSFRTYRRQGQTLTESANRGQRKSK
jgi:hypothetical protein